MPLASSKQTRWLRDICVTLWCLVVLSGEFATDIPRAWSLKINVLENSKFSILLFLRASNQVVGGSNPSGRAFFTKMFSTSRRCLAGNKQFEPPTDNKASSTNRRRRFGRPQGEPSASEAKGPQAPKQSVRARFFYKNAFNIPTLPGGKQAIRTADRQQDEFDKSPQAIWSPAGRAERRRGQGAAGPAAIRPGCALNIL